MNPTLIEIICSNTNSWFRSRISLISTTCNSIALRVSANLNPAFAAYLRGCLACKYAHARHLRRQIRESAPHSAACRCAAGNYDTCDDTVVVELVVSLKHTVCKRSSWCTNKDVINDYHLMVRLKRGRLFIREFISCPWVEELWVRWHRRSLRYPLPDAAYHGRVQRVVKLLRQNHDFLKTAFSNAHGAGHRDIVMILLVAQRHWHWIELRRVVDADMFDQLCITRDGQRVTTTDIPNLFDTVCVSAIHDQSC